MVPNQGKPLPLPHLFYLYISGETAHAKEEPGWRVFSQDGIAGGEEQCGRRLSGKLLVTPPDMKVMLDWSRCWAEKTRTYRVDRILLTGWKTKDEQQSGWARQRQKKPGRSPVKRLKKWTGV